MSTKVELQKEYKKMFKDIKKKYPKPLGLTRHSTFLTLLDVIYRGEIIRVEIKYKLNENNTILGIRYGHYNLDSNINNLNRTLSLIHLSGIKRILKYGKLVKVKSEYDKILSIQELRQRFLKL